MRREGLGHWYFRLRLLHSLRERGGRGEKKRHTQTEKKHRQS